MKKGFAALLVGAMALTTVGCSSGSGDGSHSHDHTFTVGLIQELSGGFSPRAGLSINVGLRCKQ